MHPRLIAAFFLLTASRSPLAAQGASTTDSLRHGYSRGDVEFMQGMILHHAQAIDMAALVPSHAARTDMQSLADRITVSQRDEINLMTRWLKQRGESVPMPGMAMAGMPALMPGMLSPAQMDSLKAATGAAFDTLFLRYMIQHHEGALAMVAHLLAPGTVQEPLVYQFAVGADADQRAEIARMRAMLGQKSQ